MLACPQGMQFIKKAMKKSLSKPPPATCQEQHPQRTLVVGDYFSNMWLSYDHKTWEQMDKKPLKLTGYSACASPNGFIVTGGLGTLFLQRKCYEYNARERKWRTLPSFNEARWSHSSA